MTALITETKDSNNNTLIQLDLITEQKTRTLYPTSQQELDNLLTILQPERVELETID